MIEVKNANLKDMQNKQLVRYIGEFTVLVDQVSATTFNIVTQRARLGVLCTKAEEILDITIKSIYTPQIKKKDDKRDGIFITFRNVSKANLTHFDPVIREAAEKLDLVLDRNKDLPDEEYNKETTSINSFLREVRSNLMPEVNILGLANVLDELETVNNELVDLMETREAEYYGKLPIDDETGKKINFENVKKLIIECYKDIMKHINATVVLHNTPVITEFVKKLNLKIEHYDRIIAMRKGRNKAKREGKLKNIVAVAGVILNIDNLTLNRGGSVTLDATVLPNNATFPEVLWESSDPDLAVVSDNGVVTALAQGTVTISVTTGDGGFTANCSVTVN